MILKRFWKIIGVDMSKEIEKDVNMSKEIEEKIQKITGVDRSKEMAMFQRRNFS